jgi:hypothetical protein
MSGLDSLGVEPGRLRVKLFALVLIALAVVALTHVEPMGAATDPQTIESNRSLVLAGSVWIGDRPAPAGTLLLARVGDVVCGVTLVTEPTPGRNYSLAVTSADERPGCGVQGARVTLLVAGEVAGVRGGQAPLFQPGRVVLDLMVP